MIEHKEIESKWQMRWREARAFDADPDSQREKFYLTVPYPYANAPMHVGHGRTYTIGDIIARFKRMQGYNVLWPMALHVTGTPVFGVANRISRKDPEILKEFRAYIALYRPRKEVDSILATFNDPLSIAQFFSGVHEGDFRKLGYSIDWRHKFTTNDPEYQAFVTWQFNKLNTKGYITKGAYPILYCVDCGNAVGEDDLLEGDTAKIAEFVAIKFPFEDGYLIAATLRPETIYGVTNVWVNPESIYLKLAVGEEFWYVAQPAARKLVNQGHKSKRLEEIPGRDFIGKSCKSPVEDRDLLILPADFVDPENATGIVYSVPSHAPFDWAALQDIQKSKKAVQGFNIDFDAVKSIQPISIISIKGYGNHPAIELVENMKIKSQKDSKKLEEATEVLYRAEFYEGVMKENTGPFKDRKVSEVKEDVIAFLQEQNRAIRFYQPDQRPITCKCGNEVVVAVLPDQWFINYGNVEWKTQATQALRKTFIFPDLYRRLFEATFDWLKKRPCARRRGLGTPLPFDKSWVIESLSDSTIYMTFYLLIQHIRTHKIEPRQLRFSFFDYTLLGQGDINDVSKETKIPPEVLEVMRKNVEYWYPNDLRHTAIDHITNHLSFFIFHHVAIFPEAYWPKAITLNDFVNREGTKMSKSKGNVIPLAEVPRRYGADLFRLYISQIGDLHTLIDWREKEVMTIKRRLNRLIRIFQKAVKSPEKPLDKTSLSMTSRWILSKINSTIQKATTALENFRFRSYILHTFYELLGHVEFYFRRIPKSDAELGPVLNYIANRWIRLLAPVIPHLCEEFWKQFGSISFVSLENWPEVEEQYLDEDIERATEIVSQTIADIKEIKKLLRGKTPTIVRIYISSGWKYKPYAKLAKSGAALTIKDLMPVIMKDEKIRKYGREANELVQAIVKAGGFWTYVKKATEMKALQENADLIQAETGLTVDIQDADKPTKDPDNRAPKAMPGRPALFLE